MADILKKCCNRTQDGFIHNRNSVITNGLVTTAAITSSSIDKANFDVIIVGAGFAGLIAGRELSLRNRNVLIIEGRDRIGGRTFTAEHENQKFEIGGAWIHWSQPHVWSEITRYGLSITESKGTSTDRMALLLDNGSILKNMSLKDLLPQLDEALNKYGNVDGCFGRTVFPLPHQPFAAAETVHSFDQLSMQDRLDEVLVPSDNNKELYQMIDACLSMDSQNKLSECGFIDYLHWWALGDYDTNRLLDKTGRYKITEGTSALAQAIFDDCRDVKLLLSTTITSINRESNNTVTITTRDGQLFNGRTVIITAPLNALRNLEFFPSLGPNKKRAIDEGQYAGGIKFAVKLEHPIGDWSFFAPYPNPLTLGYTDDKDGTILIVFGTGDSLDFRDIKAVEYELQKFLPSIKVKFVIGHDWRSDPLAAETWAWFRPGQLSSNLSALQQHEPPLFFASSDFANGWRGFIDGALEVGLATVGEVEKHLRDN